MSIGLPVSFKETPNGSNDTFHDKLTFHLKKKKKKKKKKKQFFFFFKKTKKRIQLYSKAF